MRLQYLGCATTVHRAQGATVDTAHVLIDPATASWELLYVALSRGRAGDHPYVIDTPDERIEPHHDQPQPATPAELPAPVPARTDADRSATETLRLAVDEHASLATLLAEYETLAEHARRSVRTASVDPFASRTPRASTTAGAAGSGDDREARSQVTRPVAAPAADEIQPSPLSYSVTATRRPVDRPERSLTDSFQSRVITVLNKG